MYCSYSRLKIIQYIYAHLTEKVISVFFHGLDSTSTLLKYFLFCLIDFKVQDNLYYLQGSICGVAAVTTQM